MNPGARKKTGKDLRVFRVVGVTAVVIDFLVYRGLFLLGGGYDMSKSISFITGAVFAYFANKAWTFGHVEARRGAPARFIVLYAAALAANVGVNRLVLMVLDGIDQRVMLAFLFATGVSAALNFLGMKFFVFTGARERM